jgi:Protein of unknown function (DUF1761)
MEVEINYWAVVLAGLSTMVVGSIWYTPAVLGNMWMKLAHVKSDKKMSGTQQGIIYGLAFVGSLVTAYVLAHVTFLSHQFFNNSFLLGALSTGFWLWLGLTATRFMIHDLFEGRPAKLTLINVAHEFVTIMIMTLIIGLFGPMN